MDLQNIKLPKSDNEFSGVKGISNVDHRDRCKKGMSVAEYIVYDFIDKFRENYPDDKISESDTWQNIGFKLPEFLQVCEVLMNKGFLQSKKGLLMLTTTAVKKKTKVYPTEEEVIAYFKENGFKDTAAKTAFKMYSVADWHDTKGNKILNWKQKMVSVWFRDENKATVNSKPESKKMSGSIYD